MPDDETEVLAKAVSGDRAALTRLLMRYDQRLRMTVSTWITPDLQAMLSSDDVLQEAFADAYRLCNRGLRKLRLDLGSASKYLSSGG